jgi:hypothetical protein
MCVLFLKLSLDSSVNGSPGSFIGRIVRRQRAAGAGTIAALQGSLAFSPI